MVAALVGHGTHVAGLVAANSTNIEQSSIEGNCRNCSLSFSKITTTRCELVDGVFTTVSRIGSSSVPAAVETLTSLGTQAINFSLGFQPSVPNVCAANPSDPWCVAFAYAAANEIVMVGASGNNRTDIQFPARDFRVVAVGGLNEALTLWDESPGSIASCPLGSNAECGSNFTLDFTLRRQELTAPAKNIRSTFYRGGTWYAPVFCGDGFGGGAADDGVGLCTGTSMSGPQVTGLVGVLRSLNPLVRAGDPEDTLAYGIRDVITQTTDRAAVGLGWDQRMGYGRPDAVRAGKMMLGAVRGETAANRATPLFTLYSSGNSDFASVATPQAAMALARANGSFYSTGHNPASPVTPGYSAFPAEPATSPPTPRANAYVLNTEFRSNPAYPALIPLYLMNRSCPAGQTGCTANNTDFLLVSSLSDLQAANSQGYGLRGIQGYIYTRCSNEPACMPPGAERIYRQCNSALDDCAVFLERHRSDYQSLGYTVAFPAGGDPVMGYAYPNVDSDGDSLVDGMESVIGTHVNDADSDDDGVPDGVEYPQAGVPISDPCAGPNITCTKTVSRIFANGFE
jgi:hypothetical protein